MQNNEQKSLKLHVYGLVQGVGFRPYVAELCKELSVAGTVRNSGGIVIIEARGEGESLACLREKLEELDGKNPTLPGARVDLIEEEPFEACTDACADVCEPDGCKQNEGSVVSLAGEMRIVESDRYEESVRFLPPDIATCPRCEKELLDPSNRRFRYPFISCFSCGPRFTIMDAVPYDREHTTMKTFPLCEDCESDYEEFGNPRHFAQTIACEKCGPKLMTYELDPAGLTAHDETDELISSNCGVKKTAEGDVAFARAVEVLKSGGVVAVKDIGGYHLAFDPYNEETAQRLRTLKHRERKPFAVMFPDMDSIRAMCEVNEKEEELLTSDARPIVLLRKHDSKWNVTESVSTGGGADVDGTVVRPFAPGVCGASDNIGAMLPCNPLQILLLKECGPLVMTSANRGGEPMIIDDDKMCEMLKSPHRKISNVENDGENNIGAIYESEGIDLVLANDREILQGLDDSVCQVFGDKAQFIRRARGYVPTPFILKHELVQETFAAGGDLKSVFAFGKKRFAYLSGHYGDLEEYSAFLAMQNGVKHFKDLFGFHEEQIVYDMHPSYASSKYAKEIARTLRGNSIQEDCAESTVCAVQHHHAHVASVIAEHGLEGKVLGVAFDGTGYGTDGTIWGGEFLLCETTLDEATGKYNHRMERLGHLKSVEMTGGDAMAKNAEIPAACYLHEAGENYGDAVIQSALDNHINTVKNSSAGRLFDAVAAVLDLCHENSYEGECPNVLQTAAERFAKTATDRRALVLHTKEEDGQTILDTPRFVADVYHQKLSGVSSEQLAYEFHGELAEAVAKTIITLCENHKVDQVAFSGGTFYNRLLLKEIYKNLSGTNLKLYINELVPSGDGGLALGQLFLTL